MVKGNQDVEIYDPVVLLPEELVLPWDPLNKAVYKYTLNVRIHKKISASLYTDIYLGNSDWDELVDFSMCSKLEL